MGINKQNIHKNLLILSIAVVSIFTFCSKSYSEETVWKYKLPISVLQSDINRLVNKDNLLNNKDVPIDLVNLRVRRVSSNPIQARSIAMDAIEQLMNTAEQQGIKLYVKSGYRSFETQNTMYKNRLEMNEGKDDGIVQYPGASEHQTGLALDVVSADYLGGKRMDGKFGETAEGKWIAENCANFGFIIRYPKDKENITGINYEPWHIRYVGEKIAIYISSNELTHEEFTTEWKAALEEFLKQGGTIESAIAFEDKMKGTYINETPLENGDTEVSITIFD